jgi:hypothetical protein
MSIFGSIMSKLFSSAETAAGMGDKGAPSATEPTEVPPSAPASSTAGSPATPGQNISAAGQAQAPVDVEAVLSNMASQKGGGGNWRTSIVDLLKLLDLDSSLNARKELAQELNVHAGADGSAEENIALHRAVMQKLAENGGKVPENMKA